MLLVIALFSGIIYSYVVLASNKHVFPKTAHKSVYGYMTVSCNSAGVATWSFDGKEIDSKFHGEDIYTKHNNLHLDSITEESAGVYTCIGQSIEGAQFLENFTLYIKC